MKFQLAVLGAVAVVAMSQPVLAQQANYEAKQNYETNLYIPTPDVPLEKNYGLPTFGTLGNEVPKPDPMVPVVGRDAVVPPPKVEPFKGLELTLPSDRPKKPAAGYTTTTGTTSSDTTSLWSTTETPLYTTTEGMTTTGTDSGYTTR
jgi:hypothetical protein